MKLFMKSVNNINKSMMWVVGVTILFMGLALFYAVVMRYFFNTPQSWAFDLLGWLTGISALLSGGYATLQRAHVRVDIFYDKFSDRKKSVIDILTSFLWIIMSIILMWKGWEQVAHYYNLQVIASSGLKVYLWIKWLMVPIGGVLLFLQGIVDLINDISTVLTGKKYYEEEIEQ